MALLGKTLKGRSTKAAAEAIRNLRVRQQNKTQDEYDQEKKLAKIKRDALKNAINEEAKIVNYNRKKLITNWRNIMRIAKTEQLKNEIEIYSQNNQRELDSKEAFLQMLDKNLDEAEDQYQVALRNHLIHIDQLLALQDSRLGAMNTEFERDARIIEEEFDRERKEIEEIHERQRKELENMIATVKEDEKLKAKLAMEAHQSFREQTTNQNLDELNHMKMILDGRQRKLNNDLDALHQKYINDTYSKTKEHGEMFKENKKKTAEIDKISKSIERLNGKIKHMKLKITQHSIECSKRNQDLKKEKENILKNYQELKAKMLKFRDDEYKRLAELATNSRNAVLKLKEWVELGERILKTAELCRRLETEKEKVIPFYESTVEDSEIPEDLRLAFKEITAEQYDEYSYLDNFYKRYNKVHLDKIAIQKQKEQLERDNALFKSMLKQYLDGISLNDDVMKNLNPLLVVNDKVNMKLPVERIDGMKTVIEGNKVYNHYRLQNNV